MKGTCLITLSLSLHYISLIKKIIEERKYICDMGASDEYAVIYETEDKLSNIQFCGKCKGCLDYQYFRKTFNVFVNNIFGLAKKHETVVNDVAVACNIGLKMPSDKFEVLLAISEVFANGKKSKDDFFPEYTEEFLDIKKSLDQYFFYLKETFYYNRIADCNDRVLAIWTKLSDRISDRTAISAPANKKVYFDQNLVEKVFLDKKINSLIGKLKNKNICTFVYSPYQLEDLTKDNKVFASDFLRMLSDITDNTLLVYEDKKMIFYRGIPDVVYKNASQFQLFTRAQEEKMIWQRELNKLYFPFFYNNNSKIPDDLEKYLVELSTKPLSEEYKAINGIIHLHYHSLNINDFLNCKIDVLENEKPEYIEYLYDLLRTINYKAEAKEKKILSSLNDMEHIRHASKTDYFVTQDKNLRSIAKFIYKVLNINTKVMDLAEFEKEMNFLMKPSLNS